jgi:hypothetical protein
VSFPDAPPRGTRGPWLFAVAGVIAALVAGGLYFWRAKPPAPTTSTPTQVVDEFLTAVFVARDPDRVAPVICDGWAPADAIARTTKDFDLSLVRVGWADLRVVTSSEQRATVSARLEIRRTEDVRTPVSRLWRFNLVDENGWRVCDASPMVI